MWRPAFPTNTPRRRLTWLETSRRLPLRPRPKRMELAAADSARAAHAAEARRVHAEGEAERAWEAAAALRKRYARALDSQVHSQQRSGMGLEPESLVSKGRGGGRGSEGRGDRRGGGAAGLQGRRLDFYLEDERCHEGYDVADIVTRRLGSGGSSRERSAGATAGLVGWFDDEDERRRRARHEAHAQTQEPTAEEVAALRKTLIASGFSPSRRMH